MKQWFSENSDKVILLVLVLVFFGGAFAGMRFSDKTILGAAIDGMKFVLGAIVGLITGWKMGGPANPPPPVSVGAPPPGARQG